MSSAEPRDLPPGAEEGIQASIADIKAGRVTAWAEARANLLPDFSALDEDICLMPGVPLCDLENPELCDACQ